MAVSSGLSRALLGIGQGYLNARNQGRRERQNLITTNARLKNDRQRQAIELAKLTSLDEDRRLKRESDKKADLFKEAEFRQRVIGDTGLELDRGMKRLEGRSGDELDAGIHQLRGTIMSLYGQNETRPYGISQDQLDRMLAAPGSVMPGVFEKKIGAGNLVNPDYSNDPSVMFHDPQDIQGIYGADAPNVGQSMAVRPEGSQNFLEFNNTPIDEQTKNLMGLMNQGASNFYGGKINAPQNFGEMMSMKPEDAYRSPEAVQQATKAQYPDNVMVSRERQAISKDVPKLVSYGMRETDAARVDSLKASTALAVTRADGLSKKLQSEIGLNIARINKLGNDSRLSVFKAKIAAVNQGLAASRLALARLKEDNLNVRHGDMMKYRGETLDQSRNEQRTLNVRTIFNTMSDIDQSILMGKQKIAEITSSPNFNPKDPLQAEKIKQINDTIEGMQNNKNEIHRWGVTETGSPQEWANIGLIGNDMATQGFLYKDPLMQARGEAMQNNPAMFGTMGSSHGYQLDRSAGNYPGVSPDTYGRAMYYGNGGREPDSPGMFGRGGAINPGVTSPVPGGGAPKPVKPPQPIKPTQAPKRRTTAELVKLVTDENKIR